MYVMKLTKFHDFFEVYEKYYAFSFRDLNNGWRN